MYRRAANTNPRNVRVTDVLPAVGAVPSTAMIRRLAWGGVIGPAAFVAAWAIGGTVISRNYSPVHDTISQRAAVGAPTRAVMTGGMIVFGLAVPADAIALRQALPGRAWLAAVATGVSTLAVAVLPLDRSDLVDALHLGAAATGYVTLAAVPLLARRQLVDAGHSRLATLGISMSMISVVALPISLVVEQTGLFQRLGLTASDVFLAASVPVVVSRLRSDSGAA